MSVSIFVIAAICGNFWQESNINPGVYESLTVVPLTDNSVYGGYGLGQWTNNPSDGTTRRTRLALWLTENGYSYDDGVGQLQYLLYENYWTPRPSEFPEYLTLDAFLSTESTDLAYLTKVWCRCWEGITWSGHEAREGYAQSVYEWLLEHGDDPVSWITGNRYLSETEIKNNAILVYKFFEGEIPPTPGKGKSNFTVLYTGKSMSMKHALNQNRIKRR